MTEDSMKRFSAVCGTLAAAAVGLEEGGPWDNKDLAEMLKDALKDQCIALSPDDGEAKAAEIIEGARREILGKDG